MADFHQGGRVATLHNLRLNTAEDLNRELNAFATSRKITLILPSLFSELEGDALPNIIDELNKVDFIHRIVIGLDRATEEQYRYARQFFAKLKADHVVLWNDGPRLSAVDARLQALDLSPSEPGKGRNVWFCLGYTIARADSAVIAVHDCDVVTYTAEMLARLVYPVVNPTFPYQMSKGFYPRVADGKLNGRVTRLLVTPMIHALAKVLGPREYLDFLADFRYPLAGEFAMRTSILPDMRIPSDWGLEIGLLSEAWRNLSPRAVCQVEISDRYDHKHQDLSEEDAQNGLSRMSVDICKALYRKLAADGTVFSEEIFRSIKATYYRGALDLIETYFNDARMNGLHVDRHIEEKAVELFANNIIHAGNVFLDNPMETPFIPNWSRVHAADPDIIASMTRAVAEDMEEYK
ncbi:MULTISPECIES: glycosyl transferase [Roseobacteraceae]|uniref:Cell wall biosynthesis glycosyltransferase n=1 Tax=Celeribacter baekdonensis B30 TaxID=1208323 RepID=K2KBG5_9RHOB|nr:MULTISPECIES: glycosyl transferase [Roseobacteraceae]EKE74690.1 cell wall biosynthesis glycosyltransferase [Celeribacter baekdonensis B30]KAB6714741.1 glycosyl transferase [Roseobacter sp. TSBP12]|tara:strand:- start:398 stop:1618 length:1221 start_codon:yes stop_codon:yes gene_type:complete